MNTHSFSLAGVALNALPSGGLWIGAHGALVVSDLHLGKSGRMARRAGALLPPYETTATLEKLADVIARCAPRQVICLGDSFDDLAAAQELPPDARARIAALQQGRRWIWVEGNHDPGPAGIGGQSCDSLLLGPLCLRHIAEPGAKHEISGHYHPKHRLAGRSHPAFLYDTRRVILPAFGVYTGGLSSSDTVLRDLFPGPARAVLTGQRALAVPLR